MTTVIPACSAVAMARSTSPLRWLTVSPERFQQASRGRVISTFKRSTSKLRNKANEVIGTTRPLMNSQIIQNTLIQLSNRICEQGENLA